MTDGRPFSEVEPDGRNPDATRTNADEASLAFVRPREGDYESPPGRKDSRKNVDADEPHPAPYRDSPPSALVAALAAAVIEVTKKRAERAQTEDGTFSTMTEDDQGEERVGGRIGPGRPSLSVIFGGCEEREAS